jgi:hypothetical protein
VVAVPPGLCSGALWAVWCWGDWLSLDSAKPGCRPGELFEAWWYRDSSFQDCWSLEGLCPEWSLESDSPEWSRAPDWLALSPELELPVKSRVWWIQGWLFLASD